MQLISLRPVSQQGHTLIELMVTMALSMLVILAIMPISHHSIRTTTHVSQLHSQINQYNHIVSLLESELKMTANRFCMNDNNRINDRVFSEPIKASNMLSHSWVSGFEQGMWHPQAPHFIPPELNNDTSAISVMFTDLSETLSVRQRHANPRRIGFVTNCMHAEITRLEQSQLLVKSDHPSRLIIYPFKLVSYYLRRVNESYTLYRQHLTRTGRVRNEPLSDQIRALNIAYAEVQSDSELRFKKAADVVNWSNIAALYLQLLTNHDSVQGVSALILLSNHVN